MSNQFKVLLVTSARQIGNHFTALINELGDKEKVTVINF